MYGNLLFSKKKCVIRAFIHKIFFRIENRKDLSQTASSKAVCLGSALFSMPFWLATSVRTFREKIPYM